MTSFVYPWINNGPYCEQELKFSLRSLEENVIGNYRVFIVGDCPPRLADIIYLKHERTLGVAHSKCVDAVSKLLAICANPLVGEHFVYMADDIAILQPFTPADLAQPIALCEVGDVPRMEVINDALTLRTTNALRAAGRRRVWNYETHLPRLFEKRRLLEVIAKYDPARNHLMVPTLYFNHFWPEVEPIVLSKMDNWLARFGGKDTDTGFGNHPPGAPGSAKAYYLRCMAGKRFANWNDHGVNQGFVDALISLFPTKATHETSRTAYVTN